MKYRVEIRMPLPVTMIQATEFDDLDAAKAYANTVVRLAERMKSEKKEWGVITLWEINQRNPDADRETMEFVLVPEVDWREESTDDRDRPHPQIRPWSSSGPRQPVPRVRR